MGYKPANEDIEWLEDYCLTMQNILSDPEASRDEKNEARMKLCATKEQIRKLKG